MFVKKIHKLKQEIDREARLKGAQKIKNYKRCIFNFEENYRQQLHQPSNFGKSFLEILPHNQTIEAVKLFKKITPKDFDSELFNNIVKTLDNVKVTMNGQDQSYQLLYNQLKVLNGDESHREKLKIEK